ncbi:hypothetical protein EYR38_003417 [Pleurotus pulmonarius]|nr:hypothetical protein EYR38_003417 [Pleurotus pulmonarius]
MEVPLGDLWELDVKKGLWTKLTALLSCPGNPNSSLPILEGPSMDYIRINGTTSCLIISGGIRGGTDFLWVDPVKREYVKLDIDGATPRSRQFADMIYSNGYLYIFGGISVWPRGGVHEARQSFCVAKMLDDTGKRWEWVRRDAPIPAKVPQLGYSVNAYLVCNESKILLVPGLTSEDTLDLSSPRKNFILFDLCEWSFSTQSNPQGSPPVKVSNYTASSIRTRALPSDQYLIMAPTEVVNPSTTDTRFYKYILPPSGPRFDGLNMPDDFNVCIIHLVTINNDIFILGMKGSTSSSALDVVDFCVEIKI